MLTKIRFTWIVLLALGVVIGVVISGDLVQQAHAQARKGEQAPDNYPKGRKPSAIVDGQYPASYFPNTELLGPDEMRLTALGTGMPNLTRAAASICFLVELKRGTQWVKHAGTRCG